MDNLIDLRQWLDRQPREAMIAIAARSALRVVPLLSRVPLKISREALGFDPIPRVFFANSISWLIAAYPELHREMHGISGAARDSLRAAAQVARGAISGAASIAIDSSADAIRAVARSTSRSTIIAADAFRALDSAGEASIDAEIIDKGITIGERIRLSTELAILPLWRRGLPDSMDRDWRTLKTMLNAENEGWEVWIEWYEDRLVGRASDVKIELLRSTLASEVLSRPAAAVNAKIRGAIDEWSLLASDYRIPAQSAGPHFALSTDLKIALAPPSEIDARGNNIGRLQELLPVVRQCAEDLAGRLNANTHPELFRNLARYRAVIADAPQSIAWGTVFGLGVRLDNAAAAARRKIEDRLQPPLEDAAQEALDSVLTLHGPLILATAEGRELMDEADRFYLTRDQQGALREDAKVIAAALKNSPEVIEVPAAILTEEAAETVGEGPHPERGSTYWLATARNVSAIAVPAAALGAFAWWVGGFGGNAAALAGSWVLRESERIRNAASALGSEYDRLVDTARDQAALLNAQAIARLRFLIPFRDFVIANEEPLRRIAGYSRQLHWMLSYIDFIVRPNEKK
jgi:hypothetical protein